MKLTPAEAARLQEVLTALVQTPGARVTDVLTESDLDFCNALRTRMEDRQ